MSFSGTVAVIGLGYIGLPTSAVLASHDVRVIGVDVNQNTVTAVNRGEASVIEPGLGGVIAEKVDKGYLQATVEAPVADAYIIAVPTPISDDKEPDTSIVMAAIESIAPRLMRGAIVIIESTCPPGTTRAVIDYLRVLRTDLTMPGSGIDPDIFVAYCPERVLPGKILSELVENDRIIGGATEACSERASAIYATFCTGELMRATAGEAEVAKLAENAFRDVNIAYANELANIATSLDVDVWRVIAMANKHPRVNILTPGPGVGGHCIAVDPWFLVSSAPKDSAVIKAAREVNDGRPAKIVETILGRLDSSDYDGPRKVACLGLAFKPDVEDMRESPAVEVVRLLARNEVHVDVVEPYCDNELPAELQGNSRVRLRTVSEAISENAVVVMLVNHSIFAALEFADDHEKILVDTRGVWSDFDRRITG